MFSRFDTVSAYDGQTDGLTDVQPISIIFFSIADSRNEQFSILKHLTGLGDWE